MQLNEHQAANRVVAEAYSKLVMLEKDAFVRTSIWLARIEYARKKLQCKALPPARRVLFEQALKELILERAVWRLDI